MSDKTPIGRNEELTLTACRFRNRVKLKGKGGRFEDQALINPAEPGSCNALLSLRSTTSSPLADHRVSSVQDKFEVALRYNVSLPVHRIDCSYRRCAALLKLFLAPDSADNRRNALPIPKSCLQSLRTCIAFAPASPTSATRNTQRPRSDGELERRRKETWCGHGKTRAADPPVENRHRPQTAWVGMRRIIGFRAGVSRRLTVQQGWRDQGQVESDPRIRCDLDPQLVQPPCLGISGFLVVCAPRRLSRLALSL